MKQDDVYIGARYVPTFADPIEWSNERTYEPLTIVTHNYDTYTSRQYVPTGIDIDNNQYWAKSGNTSIVLFDVLEATNNANDAADAANNAADAANNAADAANAIENYIVDYCNFNFAPIETKNLFDNTKVTFGYYWNYINGQKATTTYNLYAADLILVKPNTQYKFVTGGIVQQMAFFTKDQQFISGDAGGNYSTYTITTPNNCAYIGISIPGTLINNYAFYEDTSINTYLPFNPKIPVQYIPDINDNTIHVGSNYEYTSILEALKNSIDNSIIIVHKGIYNIYQEYIDYYGNDFFDNYEGYSGVTDKFYRGLWLDKGRKLFFESNANVTFSYNGENNLVRTRFAPIATCGDCEIHNLNLTFSDCRYAVHDDFFEYDGTEIFENCIFNGQANNGDTIGAGLGRSNLIIIDGCIFLGNTWQTGNDISYHNNGYASNSKSKIIVRDCYGQNAVRFKWYGTNTEVSECIACGNQFKIIECVAHTATPNETVNMHLTKWNNIETANI